MARLAGPTVAAIGTTYTDASFTGFGGGAFSKPSFVADVAGTIENVVVNITNYSNETAIQLKLYKRRGGSGSWALVGIGSSPSGTAAPQTVALTVSGDATCEVGDEFYCVFIGALSATDGGEFFQVSIDNSQTLSATVGVTSVNDTYLGTPPTPVDFDAVAPEANGQMWFQVDGTAGASEDLEFTTMLYIPGTDTPVADQDHEVTVYDDATGAVLVARQTIASVSGALIVNSQSLGSVSDYVRANIRDLDEADAAHGGLMVREQVIDANA